MLPHTMSHPAAVKVTYGILNGIPRGGQNSAGPEQGKNSQPQMRAAQNDSALAHTTNSAASGESRPRPIFKMRRTGHSGPFPFSGRPVVQPAGSASAANGGQRPRSPSLPSPTTRNTGLAISPGTAKEPQEKTALNSIGKQLNAAGQDETEPATAATTPTPSLRDQTAGMNSAQPSAEPSVQSTGGSPAEESSEPTAGSPSPLLTQSSRENSNHPQHPYALETPKQTISPDIQKAFSSAIDNQPYKVWTGERGSRLSTAGALLPAGYQKLDNPHFPWLCPVRSCRKMLPTLYGLGKHFCNAHRAASFNDNLDGTLTDLGAYCDPAQGNGRYSGGSAKPAMIVSKKPMSLAESPMAEPGLHFRAMSTSTKRRHEAVLDDDDDDDSTVSEDEPVESGRAKRQRLSTRSDEENKSFDMANPDRPYNMWFDELGKLVDARGVLIPDGYKLDTTLPDRQWICPVRTCRRLFKSLTDLAHHFRNRYRGARLNDNLDGTFSVVGTGNGTAVPVVVSRNPMDSEDIAEPTFPTYPNGKRPVWVSARTGHHSLPLLPAEASPDPDAQDVVSDIGIEVTADGRPYTHWRDGSFKLVTMGGALIPEGYQLDTTIPHRPWVCPIRSCRVACINRWSLGNHFRSIHRSCSLNDNGDGTFSIVGSHRRGAASCVVSKKPLDPNEPPMPAPTLPLNSSEGRIAGRPNLSAALSSGTQLSTTGNKRAANDTSVIVSGDAGRLWAHICSHIDGKVSMPAHPEVQALLSLPKVRELRPTSTLKAEYLKDKQVAGLIIQVTGEQNPRACTECQRHSGPLGSCVSSSPDVMRKTFSFLASGVRSCANCHVRNVTSACSLKIRKQDMLDTTASLEPPATNDVFSTGLGDTPDGLSGEDFLGRRRSTRRPLANGHHNGDDAENEVLLAGTAPEPRQKIVTLKMPVPHAGGHSVRRQQRRVATWTTNPVPESDLQMEAWEADSGRITAVGGGTSEPLAFSSTYLTANQTVQVSPAISFQAATIPSGGVHQFAVDAARTRLCTLAASSGKLRVRVGAEPEFVIGAQGVFKIAPGAACSVTNRCYIDVVLHVTALSGV